MAVLMLLYALSLIFLNSRTIALTLSDCLKGCHGDLMEDMQKNRVSHMILDLNKENPFQECV
jgi:hypothetical protein